VLKPGGEGRFLEHVRAANPRKRDRSARSAADVCAPRLADRCLCGRDTGAVLETARLRIKPSRSFNLGHHGPRAVHLLAVESHAS